MTSFQCLYCGKEHQASERDADKVATCECGNKVRCPKPGETIFYDQDNLLITSMRVQFDGNTVTPQSIEAVRHASTLGTNWAVAYIPFAVFCGLWFFGSLIYGDKIDCTTVAFGLCAVVFAAIAIIFNGRSPPTHYVEFNTTVRKYQMGRSTNKAEIRRIVAALESAIIR